MSHRKERFSSTLKQNLADILMREIDDPFLKYVFISDIIMSPDLKKASVFISSALTPSNSNDTGSVPEADLDEVVSRLTHAKGFIKRALAGRMYLKYVPDLVFIKYESIRKQETNSN
jgi:ribosome-binding factor A